MAKSPNPQHSRTVRTSPSRVQSEPAIQISGRWLTYAFFGSLAAAALCAYLTMCLLFYQGQWQIVFHPSHTITNTPANYGMAFDEIRFDATEAGVLQLEGWWIPAEPGSRYAADTMLFFHDGSGSLSDAAPRLKVLHALGINVFAFDYRGFGRSVDTHPSESRVYADAEAAWTYLVDTRHLRGASIVLAGEGLGADVATQLARSHSDAPGLILIHPAPPALTLIAKDPRTHLLPIRWLFHDRFDLIPKLRDLRTPKIFVAGQSDSERSKQAQAAYQASAEPKSIATLPAGDDTIDQMKWLESLRRFLDEQLH